MIRTARLPQPITVLAAIVIGVAACSPASGPLGTPATPPATSAPSVEVPSADVTPGAPSPSVAPSSSTSVPPSMAPGASITPAPTGATIVRAYFILGSFTSNAGLVPVLREVPKTTAVATAAMNALLAGPDDQELAARPAMYTVVPAGTRLLGLSISDGIATVNLSQEYQSGGGSASMFARLAQVVYTLTQFPTVDGVLFQLDGQPVTVFGGEGLILDHPVGRADYYDQLPMIFVDRPAWGGALGNPGTVSGLANTFEATFQVELLDATGTTLIKQHYMASCGTGCWGTFNVQLAYAVATAQWGTLRVFDYSAKDGSVQYLSEYPVWLSPAG